MKNAKDEEYYLLIPNPYTGGEDEFDIDKDANVSLVMRLIRKREDLIDKSRDNFKKLQKLRDEHNIADLEARTQKVLDKLDEIDPDNDEAFDALGDEMEVIQDSYPDEVTDLQNKTGQMTEKIDRLGLNIVTLILSPTDGVPPEYDSLKEYVESIIASDEIGKIISFFLNTSSSTTMSRKGRAIQMKSRSQKD